MKLGNLKRIDYHRARFVAECCEKSERFNVFFSCMKRSVSYYEECEDDASDVINLDHIVDKTGFQFASSLEIPESFLMQNWLYDSRHPDENTGGEYLGNQNAEIEQIHNDTVCDTQAVLKHVTDIVGNDSSSKIFHTKIPSWQVI